MGLWDTLKSYWDKDREHLIVQWIEAPTEVVAVANVHYFRLTLSEMFLSKQVAWFQSLYPAVHSFLRCAYGNAPMTEIPFIADSTKLGISDHGGQGDILARRFALVPPIPFKGGTVTLTAGLVALTGENYLNRFLKTLGTFADLLAASQLSAALNVAGPLASGIQELFGLGNGRLHLGYQDSFTAQNLKAGYIAVVRATERQVAAASLQVKGDQLHHVPRGGSLQRMTGYDYMLLKIDVSPTRDDWPSLTSIDGPLQEATRLLEQRQTDAADQALEKAVLAVLLSPDLTEAHREVIIPLLKNRYKFRKDALARNQLEELEPMTLHSVMAAAPIPTEPPVRALTIKDALEGIAN